MAVNGVCLSANDGHLFPILIIRYLVLVPELKLMSVKLLIAVSGKTIIMHKNFDASKNTVRQFQNILIFI